MSQTELQHLGQNSITLKIAGDSKFRHLHDNVFALKYDKIILYFLIALISFSIFHIRDLKARQTASF